MIYLYYLFSTIYSVYLSLPGDDGVDALVWAVYRHLLILVGDMVFAFEWLG